MSVAWRRSCVRKIGPALLLTYLVCTWAVVAAENHTRPQYAIVIVLDGFRDDYIDMYDAPTLRHLAAEGVRYTHAVGVFPSNSTVNQTSLVTGSYPVTTGIPNNSRFDHATQRILSPLRDNRAVTLAQVFRMKGLGTASVGHYMIEDHVDLYSQSLSEGLVWLSRATAPNLFVYLNLEVDSAGHQSGPLSSRTRQAVERADAQVRSIIDTLQREAILDQAVIVVVSDHGMSPTDGKPIYPNLDYQLWAGGFTVAKTDREITPHTDVVQVQHGSAFLYLRKGRFDAERERQLINHLWQIEGVEVLDRDALQALNTDPTRVGDVVVVPKEGYTLYPGSGSTGIHGRPQERHITLILSGVGVRRGVVLTDAEIVDVVPTLLHLFGLDVPATVDGGVLIEALIP